MGRELAANVWVGGVFYAAGSTPPKEAADRITNPKAWGEEPPAEKAVKADPAPTTQPAAPAGESTEPVKAPAKKAAAKKTAKKAPAKKAAAKPAAK